MTPTATIKVLCVDDNYFVRESLSLRLRREPDVDYVGDLVSADRLIETIRDLSPDVVILDIDMPGRDALEALREAAEAFPASRIIMYTGHIRRDLIERSLEYGAWGYLAKTERIEEVLRAIRKVAGGEFAMSPEVDAVFRRGR